MVLSNPSRFDKASLLTATGGSLFNSYCIQPDMSSMNCDIRLADDTSPWLEGTKVVLLTGEFAMHRYLPETLNNSLGEMRGSPFKKNDIWFIPSFSAQEAADMKAFESMMNPLSHDYAPDANEYDNDDDEGDVKRHGKTARRNYAFWLRADVRKCKTILSCGGLPPTEFQEPIYEIYPSASRVIKLLESTVQQYLYLDIETDREDTNLQCFSFSFDGVNVYCVPVLDYNYVFAYSDYHKILRALATAISYNTVVAHNGAAFDFFVLGYKYRIAINKCYDTMIAQHRCFPDIEKSLGHCTSLWTWEKFHKDEDSQGYRTREQMNVRLQYCGKDVRTMFLIHKAIEKYAKTIPGLQHSIDTAMSSIKPYLITSLQGIKYDQQKVKETCRENDELMMQYNRWINILLGPVSKEILGTAVKGKLKMFAGSNKQCCCYFHDILGYPVVARSKKTQEPSLGKQAMYKLALKHDNPVIQLVLLYRKVQKEFGTLNFTPWRGDNNEIYNPPKGDLATTTQGTLPYA